MVEEIKDTPIQLLGKAKLEFESIKKDGINPFFNNSHYATLDSIVRATDPALSKYGLAIIHKTEYRNDKLFLISKLVDSVNEPIDTTEMCLTEFIKPDGRIAPIQALGSIITYAKRYNIALLLNVGVEDDNDGNEPAKQSKTEKIKSDSKTEPVQTDIEKTKKHAFALSNWLGDSDGEMSEDCHLQFNVKSRSELTVEQWNEYIKILTEYEKLPIEEAQLAVIIGLLSKKADIYPQSIDDPAFIAYFNRVLKAYYGEHKQTYPADIKATKELRKWQAKVLIAKIIAKVGGNA